MNQRALRLRSRPIATTLAVALSFIIAGASFALFAGEYGSFVAADLDGDGYDEILVVLGAFSEHHVAGFSKPGDVCVFEREDPGTASGEWRLAFQCRSSIPEADLSGFFQPTLVSISDLDGDSLPEVAIVWYEQYWWPTAYRPLSILQFNPDERSYELRRDPARYVGEIGGYAVDDVDGDGVPEILEIDPVYETEVNPMSGDEELECHYCHHRYGIRVFEFNGTAFHVDPRFNDGDLYVTPDKYQPDVAWEAIAGFLPEILLQIRALAQEPNTASDE